jgi:hypothetical protein
MLIAEDEFWPKAQPIAPEHVILAPSLASLAGELEPPAAFPRPAMLRTHQSTSNDQLERQPGCPKPANLASAPS